MNLSHKSLRLTNVVEAVVVARVFGMNTREKLRQWQLKSESKQNN